MNTNVIMRSLLPLSVVLVVLGMMSGCATVSEDAHECVKILVNDNSTNLAFYVELPREVRIKSGEIGCIPIQIRNGYTGRGAFLMVEEMGKWCLTYHDTSCWKAKVIVDPDGRQMKDPTDPTEIDQWGNNIPYKSALGRTYVELAGSPRGGLDISQMYTYHYFKIPQETRPGKYEMSITVVMDVTWSGTKDRASNRVEHNITLIVE